MMKRMTRLAVALGAAMIGAAAFVPAHAETVKLTILGVGDIYDFDVTKERGGFARMNAVAKAERAANPNTLYVFDGDMFSPSLLSGFDKGAHTVELTNIVPFDIAVPGNHEFDFGVDGFEANVKASKYPWAALNITHADGSPIAGLGGTMMKEIAGLKIALVPVALDSTNELSSPGNWKFGGTIKTAVDGAKAARAAGADLVVGVVHASHAQDNELIASHAFDVIMSGHDHDFWTAYDGITAYVETSTDGNYLDPLDLAVTIGEKNGKRTIKWEPNFRFIDTKTVTPDPETAKIVDGLKAKLDKSLNVVIGKTETPLDSRETIVRSQEAAIGDLIADAMRASVGADIAITNGGGIRGNKEYPAGTELTRRDILTELPFGNVTVMTEITGQQVDEALENGVSQVADGAGRFPQVSGLKMVIDLKQPAGSRVMLVTVDGKPLDPSATYKVATNDYMLNGGDGYTALGGGKVLIDKEAGTLMANSVIDYITKMGTVDAKVEGRILKN